MFRIWILKKKWIRVLWVARTRSVFIFSRYPGTRFVALFLLLFSNLLVSIAEEYSLPHVKNTQFHVGAIVSQSWVPRDFPRRVPWSHHLLWHRIILRVSKLALRLSVKEEMIIPKRETHYTVQENPVIVVSKFLKKQHCCIERLCFTVRLSWTRGRQTCTPLYHIVPYTNTVRCPWRGTCSSSDKVHLSHFSSKLKPAVEINRWLYQHLSPISLPPATLCWWVNFHTCSLIICKHNEVPWVSLSTVDAK